MTNKRKILNDPVYGFITIPSELIFDIIEHPYFQRLRRIKQLGLSEFIYPGAMHSRFQHALGAMHLMSQALDSLQTKGIMIMEIEREAAQIAVLLHDLGHGPFSHALEYSLFTNISHEAVSLALMESLNEEFNGQLSLAIEIFKGTYNRTFFNQLISSQLDMDRMDYLNRDSFFTGVAEGKIGADRIIKMLNVVNNELVVEEKGLLSVENFLIARRLMYWQVYLHKTSISAESMLIKIIQRARELLTNGIKIEVSEKLIFFLQNQIATENLKNNKKVISNFVSLDDIDIWFHIKSWQNHPDYILSYLCASLLNRKLFKIKIQDSPHQFSEDHLIFSKLVKEKIKPENFKYFYEIDTISNSAYAFDDSNIKILSKSGEILDISDASDLPTIRALGNIVKKNYLSYSKLVSLHPLF